MERIFFASALLGLLCVSMLGDSTIAQAQSGSIDEGLVGYWPFDGNAYDESGYGNLRERGGKSQL